MKSSLSGGQAQGTRAILPLRLGPSQSPNSVDHASEIRRVGIEGNVLFGLLFGCDPSSRASFATVSREMPLTLSFPLSSAGGAGEGAD